MDQSQSYAWNAFYYYLELQKGIEKIHQSHEIISKAHPQRKTN